MALKSRLIIWRISDLSTFQFILSLRSVFFRIIKVGDALIKADDVYIMYRALADVHPELAVYKVFEGFGHAEFTYLGHCLLLEEIMQIIFPPSRRVSNATEMLSKD